MFNLNIKSGGKKIIFGEQSIGVRYIFEDSNLKANIKNIERITNTKFSLLQFKNFLSKEIKEIRVSRPAGKPDELVLVKVKQDNLFNSDFFRNHLAGLIQSLKNHEIKSLHIFIPKYIQFKNYFNEEAYFYQTFVEGLFLGNYEFTEYKSEKHKSKPLEVTIYAENEKLLKSSIQTAQIVMQGVIFARDLQNEPGGLLTPDELSKRIKKNLGKEGITVQIFDEKKIQKQSMGGLLAVGMGSSNPPRFIVIKYNGNKKLLKNRSKEITIALVGKGVTFDSGGISIKPYQDMWEMKADMSGAAVVAGAILSASKAKLKINIIGIIPAAENMLSGSSMRPGDIVKTYSGKTIEVDNTDAEGRMILADALSYVCKMKPNYIVDFATLTGACVVALGEFVAGIFTKDKILEENFFKLGLKTGERVWPLPMWDEYNNLNQSNVADIKNNGGRWGGAITAAKFLETFVNKKIPWIHIDIAGPSMAHDQTNYSKKYMTGFGVRLVFEYLKKFN